MAGNIHGGSANLCSFSRLDRPLIEPLISNVYRKFFSEGTYWSRLSPASKTSKSCDRLYLCRNCQTIHTLSKQLLTSTFRNAPCPTRQSVYFPGRQLEACCFPPKAALPFFRELEAFPVSIQAECFLAYGGPFGEAPRSLHVRLSYIRFVIRGSGGWLTKRKM